MEAEERAAGAQAGGAAAGPAATSAPATNGSSVGGGKTYESLARAAASQLGKTVGVQMHQKWAPWLVAQIQAPSVKHPSSVHCQWLPKYKEKEQAAMAYDVANTWRVLRGVAGVTKQNARFNFPQAGYLDDAELCALLQPCTSFKELKRVIKALLPPPPLPPELRQADASGKVQHPTVRPSKAAALKQGIIRIELTAAKLRDCRVYLKTETLDQAFSEAAAAAAMEKASGQWGWADLHLQATATDPSSGERRVFELPFGTPGHDGLPVLPSSLRPLLDLLGAQAGDVLQLQYTGFQDKAVQVTASLVPRHAGRMSATPWGRAVLLARQQGATAAGEAEQEAAAELLGMRQSQAEALLPAGSIKEQTPSLPVSPASSGDQGKRPWDASFGSGGSGSGEQPAAKRRALEPGGSTAGLGEPGLQQLPAEPAPLQLQPAPVSPPSAVPVQQPALQQQQGSDAQVQSVVLGSQSGPPKNAGSRQQQAAPGWPGEQAPQPAASAARTSPAGSRGTASAAPATADPVQQAGALLVAAQQADERQRPGQQMRAVMQTLRLTGVDRMLRSEYANLYAKLSLVQQEVQALILEGLLRESDAAAEVAAHVREELKEQQQRWQQQQQQQQQQQRWQQQQPASSSRGAPVHDASGWAWNVKVD
ncbi:hypothetical protein ABPG75_007884 [Micractinium tetrahymenae]